MAEKDDSKEPVITEITPKSEDFSRWYTDLVRRAELADYSPVKGCMVIRPYGYAIWELIQRALDDRFKASGHVNAYFPLFIPKSLLMKEAEEETLKILAIYKEFAETELAMPVVAGRKSESEKFAGAERTYSIEALMGDGRALQAGTSHNLGQNFAKAFEIRFQARDKSLQYVYGTSWGVSTRLIGGVIMTHGDDRGLMLPPRIAPYQVVIVPIPRGNWRETVLPHAQAIRAALVAKGVRVMLDDRDAYTPGWKVSEWELRGVPLRVEIGPKDIEKQHVMLARRDTREKSTAPMDGIADTVLAVLETIQRSMFERALAYREEHTSSTASWDEFAQIMDGRPGFVVSPWCGDASCEADIKAATQATLRNLPLDAAQGSAPCVKCGRPSIADAWFAKAY
jgi:prolyl-tRNA synthetase